jgi:hypothetical protein
MHYILAGKHEMKRTLGKPRHSWHYNIKVDVRETRRDLVDWIQLGTGPNGRFF